MPNGSAAAPNSFSERPTPQHFQAPNSNPMYYHQSSSFSRNPQELDNWQLNQVPSVDVNDTQVFTSFSSSYVTSSLNSNFSTERDRFRFSCGECGRCRSATDRPPGMPSPAVPFLNAFGTDPLCRLCFC